MSNNSPIKRKIQGLRGSMPSGFFLGRVSPGEGDPELVSLGRAQAGGLIPTKLPPSGAAGGDLSGTYPNPTVAAIQGTAVSNVAPTNLQVLQYITASLKWVATTVGLVPSGGTAGQILTKNSSTNFDSSWQTPSVTQVWSDSYYDSGGSHWTATVLSDTTPLVVLTPSGEPVYINV